MRALRLITAGSALALVGALRENHHEVAQGLKHEAAHEHEETVAAQAHHDEKADHAADFVLPLDVSKCPEHLTLSALDKDKPWAVPDCVDAKDTTKVVDGRCCGLQGRVKSRHWRNRVCPKGIFPTTCRWSPNSDDHTVKYLHENSHNSSKGGELSLKLCKGNLMLIKVADATEKEQAKYVAVRFKSTHKLRNFTGKFMPPLKVRRTSETLWAVTADRNGDWRYFDLEILDANGELVKTFNGGHKLELVFVPSVKMPMNGMYGLGMYGGLGVMGSTSMMLSGIFGDQVKVTYHLSHYFFRRWLGYIHENFAPQETDSLKVSAIDEKYLKDCDDGSAGVEDEQDEIDKPPPAVEYNSSDGDEDWWRNKSSSDRDSDSSSGGSSSGGSSSDGSSSDGSGSSSDGSGSSSDGSGDGSGSGGRDYHFDDEDPFSGVVGWNRDFD